MVNHVKLGMLKKINNSIDKLVIRKKRIEQKNQEKLFKILKRCGELEIPTEILAGGILEIVENFNGLSNDPGSNKEVITNWYNHGKKILNPGRGNPGIGRDRKKFNP